jgi:hypothetical protein
MVALERLRTLARLAVGDALGDELEDLPLAVARERALALVDGLLRGDLAGVGAEVAEQAARQARLDDGFPPPQTSRMASMIFLGRSAPFEQVAEAPALMASSICSARRRS